MSDADYTKAIQDIRQAIADIRADLRRIESTMVLQEDHRLYHHLPFMRNK